MDWHVPVFISDYSSEIKTIIQLILGLVIIDQIGLFFERKGWLYWRNKKSSREGFGNALQELNAFLNPSIKHVHEIKEKELKPQANTNDGKNKK